MKIALIYPPTCDPTAPYLAVPMLTGYLRREGVSVLPIDANVEAFDHVLTAGMLAEMRDRLETRLAVLGARPSLGHEEQLELGALLEARPLAHEVPERIAAAKETLRSETRFYDVAAYDDAVAVIDAALRVVSAAHHPLHATGQHPLG